MPIAWDGFKMTYTYQDTVYNIQVKKAEKDKMIVDGKEQSNTTIKLENDKITHKIEMYINIK